MMRLAEREKKMVVGGSVLGVAVLLFTYVLLPLSREWAYRGALLAPKKEYVRALRQRLRAQDSLITKREVLARRLGSLLGPEADGPAPKETESPAKETSGVKDEKPADKPAPTDKDSPDEVGADETNESTADQPADRDDDAKPDEPKSDPEPEDPEDPSDEEKAPSEKDDKPAESGEKTSEKDEVSSETEKKPGEEEKKTSPKLAAASGEHAGTSVGVTTHLGRMIQKSGMKMKRISPKSASSGKRDIKRFQSVAIQVSVEGNMEDLLDLLFAIEKGERFVRVEQLQFRRDWSKGNAVDATMVILAYESKAG